jgi:hypothetical protein
MGLANMDVDANPMRSLFDLLIQHHVAVTSTLPVFLEYASDAPPVTPGVLEVLDPESRASCLAQRAIAADPKNAFGSIIKKEMKPELMFVQAGGILLAGLDPGGTGCVIAGYGDLREIELLVGAGFTPVEAIKIATLNGAEFLHAANRVGTIAVRKQADLVVVKGDPSTRIDDI